MSTLAIVLAVVAVLAAIGVVTLTFMLSSKRKVADDALRELSGFQEKLDTLMKNSVDEIARRENLIKYLKTELTEAEEALYAAKDPVVIRERLKRVLTLPAAKNGNPQK